MERECHEIHLGQPALSTLGPTGSSIYEAGLTIILLARQGTVNAFPMNISCRWLFYIDGIQFIDDSNIT